MKKPRFQPLPPIRPPLPNGRIPAPSSPPASAFTLVEIVVSLTILALVLGTSVPSIRGVIREQQALEPLSQVAEMARTARDRSLRLQRPHQIGFDGTGCFAAPFYPGYSGSASYAEFAREADALRREREQEAASAARFGLEAAGDDVEAPFLLRFEWPEGVRVSARLWGDTDWERLEGERSLRWIFPPSGLCRPLLLRLEGDGVFAEARFHPLTAEITELRSSVR